MESKEKLPTNTWIRMPIVCLASAVLAGCGVYLWTQHRQTTPAPPVKLRARLYRFELQPGSLETFDQWISFEHANHAETLSTLEREKMYFEGVFRDKAKQPDVIYWLEVRSESGASVSSSPLAIDKKYDEFMKATLKKQPPEILEPEYILIPPFVTQAVNEHESIK